MITDHLLVRQAEMLSRHRPPVSLGLSALKRQLRARGLRLVRTHPADRESLGWYYLIDLKTQELTGTHVDVNSIGLSHSGSSVVKCGASEGTL